MTPEQKAAKLSKVQKRAILDGFAWSGHTRLALWKLGLVESLHDGFRRENYYSAHQYLFRLTLEGQQVRAILEQNP